MKSPLLALALLSLSLAPLAAEEFALHRFERKQLTDTYFSEGAGFGDLDGDGKTDLVYGPLWFAGPEWTKAREIYKPVPQNREGYADSFFNWVHDLNGDGRPDLLLVGLPGTPAFAFENPGPAGLDGHWKKHKVLDSCGNESPQFVNLVGDAMPELVCMKDGMFGFAAVNREQPFGPWEFHAISEKAGGVFTHGLGVGDVNGDGRLDVLHAKGWLEQPAENAAGGRWAPHAAKLAAAYGGADMFAYDVDGDGDSDIITSDAAHEFGVSWYEQRKEGGESVFMRHVIVGSKASESRYGILFSEPHALALADLDGDGLKDLVTGKTYYSHHKGSPLWDAGAVTYWFRLVRTKEGVDWVPHLADGEAGIGRHLSVTDLNRDGLLDIVMGGMKGGHVLIHKKEAVDQAAWLKAQPQPKKVVDPPPAAPEKTVTRRGPKSPIEKKTGKVIGALEGELLKFTTTSGKAGAQPMDPFALDQWSGGSQLWWTGGKPGAKLTLDLPAKEGKVDVEIVLTTAKDYGIVKLALDGQPLGEPIDLYSPTVITTGVITFAGVELKPGAHKLVVEIVGANAKADKDYMFGLDYIRLKGEKDDFTSDEGGIAPTDAAGRKLNLDFETGTLADWTATGKAFEGQPIKGDTVAPRRNDMHSGHAGQFWIGGYEKLQDPPTGTLSSVPFKVTHPWASYLHNGGPHNETRVDIVLLRQKEGDKVIFKSVGQESEVLRPMVVDLKDYVGQEIYIRLVDEHNGHWGHLNFDHFRFHKTKPATPVTRSIPAALALDEYPHGGLPAAEAAAAMKLPPGFKVLVGATEPEVKQPIAMAIDDRGRVWIAEAYEYPIRAAGEKGRDRILIFEDADGDGRLEKQKVFATGLNLVSGLEVGFGGVWVGAAPYLLFIPDANGDDVPDGEPKILLDGWGYQDTHETLNAFIWGPDGWLYGCHGVFTHSRVGKPGTPDKDRRPINAGVWRYHPTRHEFEVFAHGTSNPWGVDFNDHGQAFITACVIPHLFHMIHGGRYQRQGGQHFNPHTYRDIVTIADHLHYLGANPHGGNNRSDAAGGGHAHAGAMIYLGGLWPKEYRGSLFMNNIHGQRLNIDTLHAKGSGYVGQHGPDFLLTGDRASQILNLRYGPDGNAWMIDWYDMQACHTGNPGNHNRTNGRIYKIVYEGAKPSPKRPAALGDALLSLNELELVALALHPNDWYVRHARRRLQELAAAGKLSDAAIQRLILYATSHEDDTRRLRAAWVLHATGNMTITEKLLADESPYVRAWAIAMAVERARPNLALKQGAAFLKLAESDPSPVVRLALASAMQQLEPSQRWAILEALAAHPEDASDHNLPLLIWYAAEPLADSDPERALAWAMKAGESIPLLREFMLRRIGSGDGAGSLATLVRGLGKATQPPVQLTFLGAIRAALKGQRQVAPPADWAKVSAALVKSTDEEVRLQATALGVTFGDPAALAALRARIADRGASAEARRTALEALLDAKDAQLVGTLQSLAKEASPLREVALRGLAQYADPQTASLLLGLYAQLPAAEKRVALATLASRADSAIALLKAIQAKQIPAADLTADLARQLEYLKNDELKTLLASVWGAVRPSPADKLAQIASYKALAESKTHPAADLALGRAVFAKTCQKCHILYGVGGKVGPDLTGSNRANLDYLLSNLVDPSAVMAKEYQPLVLNLLDGRVVTGLLKTEDAKSVTVQSADAALAIPKAEIEDRVTSPQSMMPDDQLKQFGEHEVRSLVAYLQGKSQAPILATAEHAATLFNGKDLTGWTGEEGLWSVENGELVGRTDGLNQNEWIVNELELGDFSLKVEVKLVKNEGNSGIQFRSRTRGHEVDGYQADVGAGWWGKLYEEHGRALLWDKSGEQHIKPGEWNTYEIRAAGPKIQTFLNGQPCVDLDDPKGARRGILALQLHSGGKTEVRYRNFQLELLGAPSAGEKKE